MKNYDVGYKVGATWMSSWVPGGPAEYDEETKKEREEWLRGWHDGYASQGKDYKKLPGYSYRTQASDSHGR